MYETSQILAGMTKDHAIMEEWYKQYIMIRILIADSTTQIHNL